MAEREVRNQAVGEDAVDDPDKEDMINALQTISSALKHISDFLDGIPNNVPENIQTNAKFQKSLKFMTIVKQAIEVFKYLLECSLGQKVFDLVWRQRKCISTVISVGIQVISATIAAIYLQELTDVQEDEFTAEIEFIAKHIKHAEDMLPAIKRSVKSAVEGLRKLQENCLDKKLLEAGMIRFETDISYAKSDINKCKQHLRIALEKNQQCIDKITGIRQRHNTMRAVGLGAMAAILIGFVKSEKISKQNALIIGGIAGGSICYYKTPRYEQLYEKLRKQKEAHANLEIEVQLTEEKLDDAITSYNTKMQNL